MTPPLSGRQIAVITLIVGVLTAVGMLLPLLFAGRRF